MNNLLTRSLSGVVFLLILIGAIVFDPMTYAVLMLFIVTAGMVEYYKLLLPKGYAVRKVLGVSLGVLLYLITLFSAWGGREVMVFGLLLIPVIVAIFIAELYSKSDKPLQMVAITLSAALYIALPFSLMNYLVFQYPNSSFNTNYCYDYRLLLTFFILLWTNDVGAYCVGSTLGRGGKHKLFERISPKKSWEGFVGGLVLSMVVGFVLYQVWGGNYKFSPVHWVALGVIISVFGTWGDLVESMLKRSVSVKDSGNIMPGHGGILDRFDGALLAFPMAFAYLMFVMYCQTNH